MAFPWDPTIKTVLHMDVIVGPGYTWMTLVGHPGLCGRSFKPTAMIGSGPRT